MHCRRCGNPLKEPEGYCPTCNTANCDAVVAIFAADRAILTFLDDEDVLDEATITTIPELDDETKVVQLRNFAGLVAGEIRHKRPKTMYATGKHAPLRETHARLHHEFYRVSNDDPVQRVLDTRGEQTLEVVDIPSAEKLGGSHSTLISGRRGHRAIDVVVDHPHVRKVIPSPIDTDDTGSQADPRTKVTRTDGSGDVRLLLHDGSGVQGNHVITAATNREASKYVRDDLNEVLHEDGLQDG